MAFYKSIALKGGWPIVPSDLTMKKGNHGLHVAVLSARKWHDPNPIDPFTVDWSSITKGNLPNLFRQAPGPLNALGRIEFMFPNQYNIYLHDTAQRSHFNLIQRAQSSGCIRLANPIDLAEYVLKGDPKLF